MVVGFFSMLPLSTAMARSVSLRRTYSEAVRAAALTLSGAIWMAFSASSRAPARSPFCAFTLPRSTMPSAFLGSSFMICSTISSVLSRSPLTRYSSPIFTRACTCFGSSSITRR